MRWRWDGIDEFVAVATFGSFAAGAKSLGGSTSQVSRAIARLEERLDARLFYRTTRTVSLTDTGRILIERCRQIIEQRDEALDLISAGSEPKGELRLTCSTALGSRYLAPIVARIVRQHPRLSIQLELSNRIVDLVADGFDLAIRTGSLADSRLIATRVASRRLFLCASPEYILEAGHPQSIDDLDRFECLVGTSPMWQFELDGQLRSYQPQGRWHCNSGDAVLAAAVSGLGICQLPEFYVLPHIANGTLTPILERYTSPEEPIWAVYPERRLLLPKVRFLIAKLKAELGPALGQRSTGALD